MGRGRRGRHAQQHRPRHHRRRRGAGAPRGAVQPQPAAAHPARRDRAGRACAAQGAGADTVQAQGLWAGGARRQDRRPLPPGIHPVGRAVPYRRSAARILRRRPGCPDHPGRGHAARHRALCAPRHRNARRAGRPAPLLRRARRQLVADGQSGRAGPRRCQRHHRRRAAAAPRRCAAGADRLGHRLPRRPDPETRDRLFRGRDYSGLWAAPTCGSSCGTAAWPPSPRTA